MKSYEEIKKSAEELAEEQDAAVFVYSGGIDERGYGMTINALGMPGQRRPNAIMLLTTGGGLANSAYKIARRMQDEYEKFAIYVPAYCKSAGTLLALGASSIFMSDVAELGPLDVQQAQQDEIGKRKSGLIVRTAFDGLAQETQSLFETVMLGIKVRSGGLVSFDKAAKIATEITTGVMAGVYAQISPDTLGGDLRDLNVATDYGNRLAKKGNNLKPHTVERLVSDYPSHDFVIDREEAASLFLTVSKPSSCMIALEQALGRIAYAEQDSHFVFRLDTTNDGDDDAEPESSDEQTAIEPETVVDPRCEGKGGGDHRTGRENGSRGEPADEASNADQAVTDQP